MAKKYVIRDGFVVVLQVRREDGSTSERRYESKEEITLEDEDAELHRHKLEFAGQKDREAALAIEKQASIDAAAGSNPAELVKQLVAALSQAQAAAVQVV